MITVLNWFDIEGCFSQAQYMYHYTVSQKWGTHIMLHNSHKCGPISIILSLLYSWMNCRRRLYWIYHFTWNVLTHYLEKIECSTAQLFIQISQNNVHIRLVRMTNWEVFLFNRYIFRLLSSFECCQHHLTSLEYFLTACQSFCTAAFNNMSLTHPLTGGVTGVHASKHVCVCVLRANNFNTCCMITN